MGRNSRATIQFKTSTLRAGLLVHNYYSDFVSVRFKPRHNTLDGPVAQISGSFGPVLEYVHYTDWQNLQDLYEIDFSELMDVVTPSKPTP